MKNKRKFGAIILLTSVLLFLVFSCSKNDTKKENRVIKMTFWASTAQLPMYDEIKKAFEKNILNIKFDI